MQGCTTAADVQHPQRTSLSTCGSSGTASCRTPHSCAMTAARSPCTHKAGPWRFDVVDCAAPDGARMASCEQPQLDSPPTPGLLHQLM